LFAAVERCLVEGDRDAVDLLVVGLIEALQNTKITHVENQALWLDHLQPTTARAWSAVEAFWGGDLNAIDAFDASELEDAP
jgi:hypothetical protein